jgi:FtsP/CotA-like multicopper oxidase with cupredoxin domain
MKVNDMKKTQRHSFALNPLASALVLAIAAQVPANLAYANAGFGVVTDLNGVNQNVPTYYAASPQGIQPAWDPVTHALSTKGLTVDTGTPIRKFVDKLGGVHNGLETYNPLTPTDLSAGIPVALPEKWVNLAGVPTGDDYYEIAVVEYTQQMHSDLAKPTRLRGYVQIETASMYAAAQAGKPLHDITGVVPSEHIQALYPDGTPILDANNQQVYFVHRPHYLGPSIVAASGTPTRIKFTNYLPYTDKAGVTHGSPAGGEYYLPIDETIAGGGPVTMQVFDPVTKLPVLDANGNPVSAPVLDKTPGPNFGKPVKFSQNRVAIHWHGGDSPWTNDGTPHQWFAPRGDVSYSITDADHPNGMGVGDSYQNVPDMPDPGQGSMTLYYPMNLSGRLMMYHDHVSGLTKINAYTGQAAGLIVYDMTELSMVAKALKVNLTMPDGTLGGAIPLLDTVGIPLVIQDKVFVPKNIGPNAVASDGKTPASQDAKWDLTHWGQPGDLYFPHVYETNQDPNSIDGTNPVGRWDWGPWFWPVFPAQFSLPTGAYGDVSATPEAFLDTPTVNGQPYPFMEVEPKAYRFRILSIGNDRTFNLGFYQATDVNGKVCDASNPSTTAPAAPIAPGGVGSPASCTEVRLVAAKPTPGFPATWPTDGRAGGVPDPATAGPDIVQIGNEGGLLPAVAVLKSQPVAYDQNVRNITVFNVLYNQLTLMGGERADVLVDFSNFAGQTLILYNDAPAPFPGNDPRSDYYTGMGDHTDAGGAYDVLAGYGPNTRTVMQFKVGTAVTSGGPLDVAALSTALPVAYAATQPKNLVPESVYNSAFGSNQPDTYAAIGTGSGTQPYWVFGGGAFTLNNLKLTTGGSLYPAGATVTIDPPLCTPLSTVAAPNPACVQATASPTIGAGGIITGFSAINYGAGYTTVPNITFSAPGLDGTRATALVEANGFKVINKAIQELFDPIFGRMNATLAAELPFSTATVATTVPLAYIDTPIEYLDGIHDGETQIWKITHNGVDSHPVHFHLVNVQVINRVGWDGTIKPPAANEVGWKETLRMNPLEDVYVAVKATRPVLPFGVPASHRLLDPSQAVGSQMYFTNIDPMTGNAPTAQTVLQGGVNVSVATGQYSNQMTDFDNEYVWHCHILGHEEQDFMRPFVFHPSVVVPDAPATVTVNAGNVTWVDTTPVGGRDAQGIPTAGTNAQYLEKTSSPKNEIGYKVYVGALVNAGGYVVLNADGTPTTGTVTAVPANVTSVTAPAGATPANTVVVAYNAAGSSKAGTNATGFTPGVIVPVVPPTSAPGTTAVTGALIDVTGKVVTLPVAPVPALVVGASVSGGGFPFGTTIVTITSPTVFTTSLASTSTLPVVAPGVPLTISIAAAAALPTPAASTAPGGLTQTLLSTGETTLNWTAVPGATSYAVSVTETPNGAASLPAVVKPVNVATTTALTATIDATGRTAVVTTGSVAGLFVGETVSGGGFPIGATVAAINVAANSFTTNAASTTPNAVAQALTATGIVPTFTTGVLNSGSTYAFAVSATTLSGTTVAATAGLTNSPTSVPLAFTGVAGAKAGEITLSWANNPANKNNVAGLLLTWTGGSKTFAPTTLGATVTGLTTGTSYSFSLQAISNVAAFSTQLANAPVATVIAP